jgi:hypothetical protein
MKRRQFVSALAVGVLPVASGCSSRSIVADASTADTVSDAPTFEADPTAPPAFVLLVNQPQAPNGLVVGDTFDTSVALGNIGGEPLAGEAEVELHSPADGSPRQSATITVAPGEPLPAGAARFFRVGPFDADVAGTWELVAGTGIDRTHPEYDGRFAVGPAAE